MLNLKEYMKQVGVTKAKYVESWLKQELIPGTILGDTINDTQFPESARRPYRSRWLKAGLSADKLRAHVVKACLLRQHITNTACFVSKGEFEALIEGLQEEGLILPRSEDGIVYFDSTPKSEEYRDKGLHAIEQWILKLFLVSTEGAARGITAALLDKAS